MVIGAVLLAGGLLALSVPVSLDVHDSWGIQVKCGNGYRSHLLQAAVNDQESTRPSAPVAVPRATNYVGQCTGAIAHRRAWAVPTAGLGALIFVAAVAKWARSRDPGSLTVSHAWSADHPDDDMHEAALLDRRERAHRDPPSNTTL